MRRRISRILATAGPAGDPGMMDRLVAHATEAGADALVMLDGLAADEVQPREYRPLLKALAHANLPTFYLPGPQDAPVHAYLREAYNIEVVYPFMHGVHGGFAFGPGYVVFAGVGGEILDDPDAPREEVERLRYPAWEVEYRFKVLHDLKGYQKVFLFTTPPAHKGLHEGGSTVLAEMIKSYQPRVALISGPPRQEWLGTSLVATAGRLADGECSLINLPEARVEESRLR
jgi:hypothetical protein